jgi:starvation-inducible DNA-binding protein
VKHQYAPANMSTDTAEEVASVLQERLSTLIDLSLILKHIHWNVVGMGFVAVHELMDQQTESVRMMVDSIAERISTLGGVAAGLASQVSDMRDAAADYELGRAEVMAHLGALDKVYESVTAAHRSAIEDVSELDPITEDLLIGQAGDLEIAHWFVRAHISNVGGELATAGADTQLEAAVTAAAEIQPGVDLTEENTDTESTSHESQTAGRST